jgi:hypothetical protein
MVGITDENGKLLKHYAQDTVTRKRYILIALENQTDPNTCSVVDMDALEQNVRAELISLVNSPECQMKEEIWQVLDKKYFLDYPQATMLKVLKAMHQIQVVDSKQVAVSLPGEQIMTPKELANAIREYKKSKGGSVQQSFVPDDGKEVLIEKVGEKEPNKDMEEVKESIKSLSNTVASLADIVAKLASAEETKKKK